MLNKIFYVITVPILLLLIVIAFPDCRCEGGRRPVHDSIANLDTIQISLERYCNDHTNKSNEEKLSYCEYPEDISSLITEDYLTGFPFNPYLKKWPNMKNIELGSEPESGDFTYVPLYENGKVKSYFLLVYGDNNTPNETNELDDYRFKRVLKIIGRDSDVDDEPPSVEGYFLKGASVPTLLDKWKKPATGAESTDNGE